MIIDEIDDRLAVLIRIEVYHKIIQANGALNLVLFELKIKLLTYYYLQIIKIGLFVERNIDIDICQL